MRSMKPCPVGVFLSLVTLTLAFLVGAAHAGTIEKVRWRGHDVLKLTGSIDDDLVTDFMSARDHAGVWPHGAKVLLLDSGGGGVMAALAIVNLMDQGTWQTVIPNGAECASPEHIEPSSRSENSVSIPVPRAVYRMTSATT